MAACRGIDRTGYAGNKPAEPEGTVEGSSFRPIRILLAEDNVVNQKVAIAMLGGLAFALMALRVPAEEANLIATFGDEYRRYMERTGRYLPKLKK